MLDTPTANEDEMKDLPPDAFPVRKLGNTWIIYYSDEKKRFYINTMNSRTGSAEINLDEMSELMETARQWNAVTRQELANDLMKEDDDMLQLEVVAAMNRQMGYSLKPG